MAVANFHVQVEEWKDSDEEAPKEKETLHFVRKKRIRQEAHD